MTFDPRAKKWKIFLRRQWLVFHCVSLRSLFYHCHAFRFLFWVQEFSRISRKSSTLPDFYWFCCRPINASRFKIRTSHSITSIRHWLVTWWITFFSLLSCREDKKSHQLVTIPRQDTLFWRSDSKKSGKEIVQKYRSTVETDPSIIYIIFGYKLYSSPKLGVDPKIYWVRYYGSFSVFFTKLERNEARRNLFLLLILLMLNNSSNSQHYFDQHFSAVHLTDYSAPLLQSNPSPRQLKSACALNWIDFLIYFAFFSD